MARPRTKQSAQLRARHSKSFMPSRTEAQCLRGAATAKVWVAGGIE
jgi:hypothetical protein